MSGLRYFRMKQAALGQSKHVFLVFGLRYFRIKLPVKG